MELSLRSVTVRHRLHKKEVSMKLHINSQMYAQITPDFVSLISTETDQVILHIPSYTMKRLNELMLVQQHNYHQESLQGVLQMNSTKDME